MTVVRLASAQERIPIRSCRDCRFYEPQMHLFFNQAARVWSFSWRWPFIISHLEPTAAGHAAAICTAFGGEQAKIERRDDGRCKPEGRLFEPRTTPQLPTGNGQAERRW